MKLLYVLAATAIILSPHHAIAQAFTLAQIRDQLGGPVDIEAAALFAAARASYKNLCGADPEAEFHAAIINRLQYRALDDVEKPALQQLIAGQVTSNAKIFTVPDLHAQASFCDGLNGAVLHSAAKNGGDSSATG